MTDPAFDADSYPSDATLHASREWPFPDMEGRVLDFIAAAWKYPGFGVSKTLTACEADVVQAKPHERYLRLATGGWSGNESLLAAFAENPNYQFSWCLSTRGGLYIFRYMPKGA